ncbi:MAG: AI-2E family transporter [Synechococcales cyanobacterium C42_A2020_086]|nr:AI-2E family transporter [Synechococcales cyanobacterium M58_A2018_015]MBF2074158.1 AI-2E family transporter [Synechococcales cyanobacterium C42_A2020_086]
MKFGKWFGLILLLIALYVLWRIRQVLLLVFTAVVLAIPLNRLVRRLQRSGMQRGVAALLSVTMFLTALLLFVGVIVPPFVDQFQQLVELVPRGLQRLQGWFFVLQTRLPGVDSFDYVPSFEELTQQARPFVSWVVNNFFALFSNFLLILLNLLLILVLTTMLLVNPTPYRQGFIAFFPAFYRPRVDSILTDCEAALIGWIRGVLIDMAVIGTVVALGLWILRVPLVLANAALAGLLEAIPNIGPTLSLVPPLAIALLDAPWKAVAVVVFYIVIQQLEQYLLVPVVMQKQVSLLPAVTLLAQVVFAAFFGFLGLLLAIPLVIVGQIVIREALIHDVLDRW